MTLSIHAGRRHARGFTLIEMMITVAIIGILVAVAFPAYNQSVVKSRRSDAKTALLDLAQREERYLSTANQYTTSAPLLGYGTSATLPVSVMSGSASYYQLAVTVPTSAPTTFSATATPTGVQATKDTQCATYGLTQTGAQSVTGTSSASPGDCW